MSPICIAAQVCGDVCPEGYAQLPCGEAEEEADGVREGGGCRTCNLDGRRGITCALRRPCLPAFTCDSGGAEESSAGASDTSLPDAGVVTAPDGSTSVALLAPEGPAEAAMAAVQDFVAGNDAVAAALAPEQEGVSAAGDLVVPKIEKEAALPVGSSSSSPASVLPSDGSSSGGATAIPSAAAGLLEDPRNSSAVHATFLFVDLTLELIEVRRRSRPRPEAALVQMCDRVASGGGSQQLRGFWVLCVCVCV